MTLFDDPPAVPVGPELPTVPEDMVKAGVLEYLADVHAPVLDWLRRGLIKLYRFRVEDVGRDAAYVTADDARKLLPRYRGEVSACKNFMGALFQAKGWQFTGHRVNSQTPGSHSNELKAWRYVGSLLDGGPYGREPKDTTPETDQ